MLSVCLTSIHFISGSEGPGRLDHEHLMSGLYNQVAAGQRPESASSASPPSNQPVHFPTFPTTSGGAGMLVVPQPINASKVCTSVCEVTVHHITTTCHLPSLHTYHLYGQPAMFLTCKGEILIFLHLSFISLASDCPLFRWEGWEGTLGSASLITTSTADRGNTNAKCVHR